MSEDGFYWVVDAHYALLDSGIDLASNDFRLTDNALRILRGPGGLKAFYEACGEFFYSGMQQEARYSLLYEFKSSENRTIEEIRAKASGQAFGIRAKAEFEKFADLAVKASVLRVHAARQGGGADLASYALKPEMLEQELSKLRRALYDKQQGVQARWFIQDYNGFAEIQEAKAQENVTAKTGDIATPRGFKGDALVDFYEAYQNNLGKVHQLRSIAGRAQPSDPLVYFTDDRLRAIFHETERLQRLNHRIDRRAKECLHGGPDDCRLDEEMTQSLLQPHLDRELVHPDKDQTNLQGWRVFLDPVKTVGIQAGLAAITPGNEVIRFYTGNELWHADRRIFAEVPNPARASYDFTLGTPDLVRDPWTGQLRVNLCTYDYSDRCSLRIIETAKGQEMLIKLQLVVFDEFGFVVGKRDFPIEN